MEKKNDGVHNFNNKKLFRTILFVLIVIITIIVITFIIKEYKVKSEKTDENITTESETKSEIPIEFSYKENYWEKYDLTNAVYKTQAEYETTVLNYIDQITKILNKQDWYEQYPNNKIIYIQLNINDIDEGISEGRVSFTKNYSQSITFNLDMSNTMFKHNRSQLVHALTELIITGTEGYTNSMEEGIGEYVQNQLGMGIASYNYGLDIHNFLIEFTKKYEEDDNSKSAMSAIRARVGTMSHNIRYSATPKNHISHDYWILCSYSFVDYLAQTYGIDSVMKMIEGYDESIYFLYNENGLSGLLSDWNQFLENYPCKITWDEIDEQITELESTHGY